MRIWARLLVLGYLVTIPAIASAQTSTTGAIAGTVRDTTGAVLPGVTVEASSPALIEKNRTVVTDGDGLYRIVELRPGTYTVTFSLSGFGIVSRQGLQLNTGVTLPVNAELRVGDLQETVTVSGDSPLVDVQNVRTQTVLTSETLSDLPSGKGAFAWAALSPGMTATIGGDLGGTKNEEPSSVAFQGGRHNSQRVHIDGMTIHSSSGSGSGRIFKENTSYSQEVVLETSGMSADTETSGLQVNIVPRDGGNTLRGSAQIDGSGGALQSENLDDGLRARGLNDAPSLKNLYNYEGGFGGPFAKDKLWFFTAHRWWGAQQYVPSNYYNKTPHTLFYTPDLARPAYTNNYNQDHSIRLTWQAAPKHKITVSESLQWNCSCYYGVDTNIAPESTDDQGYYPLSLTQGTWTFPITNRLLLQAGYTYGNFPHISGEVGEERKGANSTFHDPRVTELSTGYRYGAATTYHDPNGPGGGNNHRQQNGRISLAHVTGKHAFKAGFQFIYTPHVFSDQSNDPPIAVSVRKPSPTALPVPESVTYAVSPRWYRLTSTHRAFYVQDQWTVRRLTLNMGVRYDSLVAYVPAQTGAVGVFTPAVTTARIDDVPNWKDITPRVGAAYDLFGNGKTSMKMSVGRYVLPEALGIARGVNPITAISSSTTRNWTDANQDYIPQESELGPSSNALFGTPVVTNRYAPELLEGWGVRPDEWYLNAAIQHELGSGVALSFNYYHRSFGNYRVTDNLAVTPADYDPFCVTQPLHALLPGGGGKQVCGYYNLKQAKFGLVDNLIRPASDFGEQTEVYNGFDIVATGRLASGVRWDASVSSGQSVTDTCFVVDSPQDAQPGFCRETYPFSQQVQYKANVIYPLPWGVQASAVYQNIPGASVTGTTGIGGLGNGIPLEGGSVVVSNAAVVPSLGRNLGACANLTGPCTATVTVNTLPAYEGGFEARLSQLDARLSKTVVVKKLRIRGLFDIYNIFNANTILSGITRVGPSYRLPIRILGGRLFKFGAQINF